MQQVERETKRLQTVQSEAVRASLARMLAVLKDAIAQLEARVEALIASQAELYQSRGQSLPVGYTPAYPTHRKTTYAWTKTHSGRKTHRRRTLYTLQTRTQPPHRQTPPSPLPPQTRHTDPTSRPHRGRLANVHSQVAHLVSHRGTGRTHPSHARRQPSHAAFTVDPRPTGTAHPARRYTRLSHAPRGSRVVSRHWALCCRSVRCDGCLNCWGSSARRRVR